MLDRPTQETLADLRAEIDRIDARMHEILIERGEIIDRLIAAKSRSGSGSAFRPGREADMMRRLVARHKGILPLDTVESVWRIIISTFTFVQAPYTVHGDVSAGDAPMRDCCRFHFGFTVPFVPHLGIGGVIDAVSGSQGDLGLVPVEAAAGPWWTPLTEPAAPQIIARLPFVERRDHPAGMPLFVLAKPLSDGAARDVMLYSVTLERWDDALPGRISDAGAEIISVADHALLISAPNALNVREILPKGADFAEIGSHAARFDFSRPANEARSGSAT
ncbi:MAG TPA: chorismate mutase [Methylovirgula sp.]|nr:chorismate mutase [Methylovirgula sp.]